MERLRLRSVVKGTITTVSVDRKKGNRYSVSASSFNWGRGINIPINQLTVSTYLGAGGGGGGGGGGRRNVINEKISRYKSKILGILERGRIHFL